MSAPILPWPVNSWTTTSSNNATINYANGQLNFTSGDPPNSATLSSGSTGSMRVDLSSNEPERLKPYLNGINKDLYSTMSLSNTGTPTLASDFLQKRVAELENKCKSLQERNSALESAIGGYEMEQTKLEQRLDNQRHNYEELQDAHDALRKLLDSMPMSSAEKWSDYEDRIAELERLLSDTEARLSAQSQHGSNVVGIRDGNEFYPLNDDDDCFHYTFRDDEKQAIRNLADAINERRFDATTEVVKQAVHSALDERAAEEPKKSEPQRVTNEEWDMLSVDEKIEFLTHGATVWRASKGDGPFRTIVQGRTKAGLVGETDGFECHDRNGKAHVIPVTDIVPEKPEPVTRPSLVSLVTLSTISLAAMSIPAFVQFGWKGGVVGMVVSTIITALQTREFRKAL